MNNKELTNIDREYLWHPWTPNKREETLFIVSGNGCYVTDIDGKQYLDATSGALNVNCGYNNKNIINSITKQLGELVTFELMNTFSTIPPVKLAKKISDLLPQELVKTFFCNSGSECVETAIKMARQYSMLKFNNNKKYKIIALSKGYHGTTSAAMYSTGNDFVRGGNLPIPHGYEIVYPYNNMDLLPTIDEIREKVMELGSNNIAAFIMEPILGIGGLIIPEENYLKDILNICKKNNILFILDETMTGFGRTGKMFAFEHYDCVPDILITGKGISGGHIPLGAVTTSNRIFNEFNKDPYLNGFRHGHTNSGHTTATLAALATIKEIEENNMVTNSHNIGEYILNSIKEFPKKYNSIVSDVRGKGLVIAISTVSDTVRQKIANICRKNGLIVRQIGSVIGLLPPLNINLEAANEIVEKLNLSLAELHISIEGDMVII